jgi:ribonuclease VapC
VILDSSALVAIIRQEEEASAFAHAVEQHHARASAATILETALVLRPPLGPAIDDVLDAGRVEIVPFDDEQLRVARDAMGRYGRGSGSPAGLNFGDCISYALAKVSGEPLLFKGDDFTHTDVTAAWMPEIS